MGKRANLCGLSTCFGQHGLTLSKMSERHEAKHGQGQLLLQNNLYTLSSNGSLCKVLQQ